MGDAVEALWKICGELFNKVFHSYCGKVESLSFPLFSVERWKRNRKKKYKNGNFTLLLFLYRFDFSRQLINQSGNGGTVFLFLLNAAN